MNMSVRARIDEVRCGDVYVCHFCHEELCGFDCPQLPIRYSVQFDEELPADRMALLYRLLLMAYHTMIESIAISPSLFRKASNVDYFG